MTETHQFEYHLTKSSLRFTVLLSCLGMALDPAADANKPDTVLMAALSSYRGIDLTLHYSRSVKAHCDSLETILMINVASLAS